MIPTKAPTEKRAIFSVDANPMYLFFAPITALVWKKFIKYIPIVLVAGKEEDFQNKPVNKFCINTLKSITSEVIFIDPVENLNNAHLAQISRIYCGCLDFPDGTYLLTSDVDMWPMSVSYFQQHNWSKDLHLMYANAYGGEKFPLCYTGANSQVWREIMKVEKGNISEKIKKQIFDDVGFGYPDLWNYDEKLLSKRIKEWRGWDNSIQMMNRHIHQNGIPDGRIDRSNWSYNGFGPRLIDAHLLRPGQFECNWEKLRIILKKLLNVADFNAMQQYRDTFIELENNNV